jgi:cytochrome c-type biogenesis protein CcmH/NrfG
LWDLPINLKEFVMATRTQPAQSSVQSIRAAAAALRAQRQQQPNGTEGLGFLVRTGIALGNTVNGFGDAADAYQLKRAERS